MNGRVRELREEDIPGLTLMWNESDTLWPGGFTSGMPLTPERVRQWHRNTDYLAALVAVAEERVVGFCGLTRLQSDAGVAYVSVLGIHPSVLDQGYGRDLLRAAIARAATLGFRRLDLDTWSANTRAIPLYKRTGFFWVPGTSVNMQNFIPLLLQEDLVRAFLAGDDWYACLRPTVTLDEDVYAEGGLPVFPYVFERNGERQRWALEVTTGGLIAYADAEVGVSAEFAQAKAVVGAPLLARCRVERRSHDGAADTVSLFAEGRGGVIGARTVVATVEQAATFEVEVVPTRPAPEGALPNSGERPGLAMKVAVGRKGIVLQPTFPVLPAVEAFAEPSQISLTPGRTGSFWLGARSNLAERARVRLHLTGCDHLTVRPLGELAFDLDPGAAASRLVEASAPAGLHTLHVLPLVEGAGDQRALVNEGTAEVYIVAGGPSDAFAYRTQTGAILENAHLRAIVSARGGIVRLQMKNPTLDLVEQRATIGAPFWPSEFFSRQFDVQVDVREGRASVHLAAESAQWQGLLFRHTLTLTASPQLETEFSLVNASDRPHRLAVRAEHVMRLHSSLVAVPLAEGLLVDSTEAAEWETGAPHPECYAETWASLQREDLAVGFLWPEGTAAEFSRRYGPFFTLPEVAVEPGATAFAGRVVLTVGRGGWRSVRDQWRRLFQPEAPERAPSPVRAAQLRVTPSLVAWSGRPVRLELQARHLRTRALSGTARLELPQSWSASARVWEVLGLKRGHPQTFHTVIQLEPAASTGEFPPADEATLLLDANLALGRQAVALLALGRADAAVRIAEMPVQGLRAIVVDNGWARFAVAPHFAAAVVSFERDGINHLLSPFPTPGQLMWQRPWFGGLAPVVAPAGVHFHPIHAGRLHEEEFAVQHPIAREHLGATWRGLRLSSALRRPAGLLLEVDYLTLGGSNLLLVVVRLCNPTSVPVAVQSFLACYLQVSGDVERTVLRYLAEGEHNTRRTASDVWLAPSADWAAVESERTGMTAALVSATPWATIQAYDLGLEGAHLFNVGETLLAPHTADEYATYFVLTDRAEKARRYRALGWSGEIGVPPEH